MTQQDMYYNYYTYYIDNFVPRRTEPALYTPLARFYQILIACFEAII